MLTHLAVIPDGAGRWAKSKGLPRASGYAAGTDILLEIIDAADEQGLAYLSFYAFSVDNYKRGTREILSVSSVYTEFIDERLLPLAIARGYKLRFIGAYERLTPELMSVVSKANAKTINNRGMTVSFALAYDGVEEMARAVNYILEQKFINADYTKITTADVEPYTYTAGLPPVDALVRFGGCKRLSGFMPLKTTYAELFFSEKLFPDVDKGDIFEICKEYKRIKRKFGEIK